MFPVMTSTVEIPQMLDPNGGPRSRVNTVHARAVREAGKKTLIRHQVRRLPAKFRAGAHHRYGYANRSPVTSKLKRRRGQADIDLVKSGRTRTKFTKRRPHAVRVRGNAISGKSAGRVVFTMVLRFPFPRSRRGKGGITVSQMAREVESVDQADAEAMAKDFAELYMEELKARLKPRQRRRLGI